MVTSKEEIKIADLQLGKMVPSGDKEKINWSEIREKAIKKIWGDKILQKNKEKREKSLRERLNKVEDRKKKFKDE